MLLFGGVHEDSNAPHSELLCVDLETYHWWVLKVGGGDVIGRAYAAMCSVDQRVYIFGGAEDQDAVTQAPSFCVSEYNPDRNEWTWLVRDQAYPGHVPHDVCPWWCSASLCWEENTLATWMLGRRRGVWHCLRIGPLAYCLPFILLVGGQIFS